MLVVIFLIKIITVALIASKYFHGNVDHAIAFVKT